MDGINEILRIHSSLGTFWWILLGLFFVIYIVLDGADLGAGVFSLMLKNENDRAAVMASMAGTWDA
ncbi:MAG: cytochrome d ubiquinol oxidase subunit II, partial [Acidithiobacillus sp.]